MTHDSNCQCAVCLGEDCRCPENCGTCDEEGCWFCDICCLHREMFADKRQEEVKKKFFKDHGTKMMVSDHGHDNTDVFSYRDDKVWISMFCPECPSLRYRKIPALELEASSIMVNNKWIMLAGKWLI